MFLYIDSKNRMLHYQDLYHWRVYLSTIKCLV